MMGFLQENKNFFRLSGILKALRVSLKYFLGKGAGQKQKSGRIFTGRGDIALRRKTQGESVCVGCKLCAKVCPANALDVQTEREKNGWKVVRFQADMNKCIYCGLCVEACPVKALIHTMHVSAPVTGTDQLIYDKEQLENKVLGSVPDKKDKK